MTASLSPDDLLAYAQQRRDQGDLHAADNFVAMVLEKYPSRADAWALSAELAYLAGNGSLCLQKIEASLQRCVDEPLALTLRGTIKQTAQDWLGAGRDYLVALQKRPTDDRLMNNLATCLRMCGQLPEALAMFRQAVACAPQNLDAWNNIGIVLHESGDAQGAEAAYRHALSLNEGIASTHNNLAALLQVLGRHNEAEQHYRRALGINHTYAASWKNLAGLYQTQHRWQEALACYDQASAHQTHFGEAQASALHMAMQLADWQHLGERCAALLNTLTVNPQARIAPFAFLALDEDPQRQLDVARRWARGFPASTRQSHERADHNRLRIGYLGGDFFAHATSWLTEGLFAGHDRRRFEVFGYDYGRDDQSTTRQNIIAGFDHFRRVAELRDIDIAQQIRADRIDILIDLKGWTRDSRAEILAYRPAPVQVHYLAYPGSLGSTYHDYLIGDAIITPPEYDAWYDEAIVRLPHSYQINNNARVVAETPPRAALGLPETALVLVCFNQHYKINPLTFDIWMRLLREVPDSVLWLMETHPQASANLRHEASKRNVDPSRLHFAPSLPQAQHLGRLRAADLAIDSYPFTSHTTASDALWAGVPLVTCMGRSFASRVAASCLHAVGLDELISHSLDDYAKLLLSLTQDRQRLSALRKHLADNRDRLPLFDTLATTHALERAYEAMWARYAAGSNPAAIEISSD